MKKIIPLAWKTRFKILAVKLQQRSARAWGEAQWAKKLKQKGVGFYGKLITLFLCLFFLSDLTALLLGYLIPDAPVVKHRMTPFGERSYSKARSLEDYDVIFTRNLFNSKGLIPGEESFEGSSQDLGGSPVRTSLPFNLIGTMVLQDEMKSIATIEDKSNSMVYPVQINDEIPSKARILKIESHKVIFVNSNSGRREYIDLPEDLTVVNPRVAVKSSVGGGIERVSPNQFNIARSEVDKTLADLNNVLTQARAVPNFENGVPSGYKLFQIVPGSIYDKLGLQNGDTICGINGQNINDPSKAFESLSELKTANHFELCVKRDGKQTNYAYDFH